MGLGPEKLGQVAPGLGAFQGQVRQEEKGLKAMEGMPRKLEAPQYPEHAFMLIPGEFVRWLPAGRVLEG